MNKLVLYCLGFLGLLLLQGVFGVEGRSILSPGNNVIHTKEDTDVQNKIITLLLQKSLLPVEKNDALGLDLASRVAELEELEALRDDLELKLTANALSTPKKRAEACFWKYCV
ncbi:urotensin 2 domain containing [Osmerus mordax]